MKKLSTTDLCDEYFEYIKVLEPIVFKSFGKKTSFHGEIVTVKCFENNALIKKVLEEDGRGKVLVVDGEGSYRRALMGGNVAKLAEVNHWEGVLIYGSIRDSLEINECELGIKALHLIPVKSGKEDTGSVNIPVKFAGVSFVPKNYLYSDEDGIIVSEKKLH